MIRAFHNQAPIQAHVRQYGILRPEQRGRGSESRGDSRAPQKNKIALDSVRFVCGIILARNLRMTLCIRLRGGLFVWTWWKFRLTAFV